MQKIKRQVNKKKINKKTNVPHNYKYTTTNTQKKK